MRVSVAAALLLPLSLLAQSAPVGTKGFYRFPAVSGQTVVFAAEGDLWSVPLRGGLAHRLTSHAAEETDPTVSPRWQDAGLHRALRRAGRALHHAAVRWRPHALDL